MTLLVVGLTHRQTPLDVLERAAVPEPERASVLAEVLRGGPAGDEVGEAMLLSTCNRVELYADVARFHGGFDVLAHRLADRVGVAPTALAPYLEVRYGDEAAEHAFRVAAGLDSAVVGEPQVLGQFRSAYQAGTAAQAVGRELHALAQQALRAAKRVHAELGVAELGRNIASVAVELAGVADDPPARAVVLGAGDMGTLAAHALRRTAPDVELTVLNRSPERAVRLAAAVDGTPGVPADLDRALATADLLVTATSATVPLVDAERVRAALGDRPLRVVDLCLPRAVAESAAALPQVHYVGLADVQREARDADVAVAAGPAEQVVTEELAAYHRERRGAAVAPTVTALRAKAAAVVTAELARLHARLPDLDETSEAQVRQTVSRIVDKILHAPSVRVRELAGTPTGDRYAEALRTLFDLADTLPGTPLAAAADPGVREASAALESRESTAPDAVGAAEEPPDGPAGGAGTPGGADLLGLLRPPVRRGA